MDGSGFFFVITVNVIHVVGIVILISASVAAVAQKPITCMLVCISFSGNNHNLYINKATSGINEPIFDFGLAVVRGLHMTF